MTLLSFLVTLFALTSLNARADGYGWKGVCLTQHPDGSTLEITPWDDDAHVHIQGGMTGQMVFANEVVSVSTFDQGAKVVKFEGDNTDPKSRIKSIVVTRNAVGGFVATAKVTYKNGNAEAVGCKSFGTVTE